jgi:hypothetical protein
LAQPVPALRAWIAATSVPLFPDGMAAPSVSDQRGGNAFSPRKICVPVKELHAHAARCAHAQADRLAEQQPHARIGLTRPRPAVDGARLTSTSIFSFRGGNAMPEEKTRKAAARDKREGKAPSTQAGEFVHEEIEHVREGKHGARSAKQAIAIGLSKARRSGVKVPAKKSASKSTRKKAAQDERAARHPHKKSARRSRATSGALKREGRSAASSESLSRQGKRAASKRSSSSRSAAAKKAARTKGTEERSAAAKKAARTRSASSRSAAAKKAARTRSANRPASKKAASKKTASKKATGKRTARKAPRKRSASSRSAAAKKAARTRRRA